jgi:CRP/FNR family transcriptional regulator, cyclic AMP receptor protein
MGVKASAETLRSIPLFTDCEPVHLQVLAFSAQRHDFGEGERVVTQGGKGLAAFLILEGSVELLRDDGQGVRRIGDAGPGALIGEIAMIADRPYSITATAATPVQSVLIDRQLFMRVAEEYPEFGARVYRAIAKRLEGSMADLGDIKGAFDRARSFTKL